MTAPAMCCCECGAPIGAISATYRLDQHELICHATGASRLVAIDAAVACSARCLARYLGQFVPTEVAT